MRRIVLVYVGGGLGACLRALWLAWLAPGGATSAVLLANLIGAFILGVVFILADEAGFLQASTRLFLAVGVLGGFTTFSTFAWGVDLLAAHGGRDAALDYVIASVGGGALAVAGGLMAGRELVIILERASVHMLSQLDTRGLRRTGVAREDMAAIETEDREPLRALKSDQEASA